MSTTKKLSEKLWGMAETTDGIDGNLLADYSADARALEERVAELEHLDVGYRKCCAESSNELAAATARAEAAEAEVESVKADNEAKARANAQLVAEVAYLREKYSDALDDAADKARDFAAEKEQLQKDVEWWHRLWDADVAEQKAEVARLREEGDPRGNLMADNYRLQELLFSARAERDALRAKLEKYEVAERRVKDGAGPMGRKLLGIDGEGDDEA